jgi:hypothetical protein
LIEVAATEKEERDMEEVDDGIECLVPCGGGWDDFGGGKAAEEVA